MDDVNGESDTMMIPLTPSQLCNLIQSQKQEEGKALPHCPPPSLEGLGSNDKIFLLVRKVDAMASSGSSSSNSGPLSVSQQDGGKNKRKLVDHSPQDPLSHPSSWTEFPRYESSSEKSQNPRTDLRHLEVGSSQHDDWDDPLACQLEGLLLSAIHTIYQNAITLLVRRGYDEDIAQKAISRLGFYHGGTDIVENVVNEVVSFLKNGKDNSRDIVFENLQQMVVYTLLELVNVLRQVKPSLSTGKVMWWLLIGDMNISQACEMEEDLLGEFSGKEISGESSSNSLTLSSKSPSSELLLNTNKPNIASSTFTQDHSSTHETLKFGSFPNSPNLNSPRTPEKESMLSITGTSQKSLSVQHTSQAFSFEENLKTGSKSFNKKELATLQKTLSAGRALRNHGKSISQSGKITNLGGLNLEKRLKSPSKSHGVQTKGSAPKMKAKVGASTIGGSCQVTGNAPSIVSTANDASKVQTKEPISALATETTEHVVSGKKPVSKLEANATVFPKISDYCAGIPYDKSLGKYVPQDEKDELILKLVPQVQALQNNVQGWTDWANQKVMQATRRLGKDKLEMKALKQEKEEAEQFKKEKKVFEENAMKRLSEMEFALGKATGQVKASNSTIQNLEGKRSELKKEMEIQKLRAVQTARSCQEAFERELKAIKNIQSMNKQKRLLEDELKTHKQKVVELQQEKCKAEKVQNQIEGKWNQERALKEALLAQFASIKYEQDKVEAARKAEEDMIRQRAENDAKKYKEDVAKLEKQVSEIKLKSDASRIAALKRGMEGSQDSDMVKMAENFQETFGTKGLKRERECVMCLSEEKSVVFLPCAHQVLCMECNELHQKEGMEDCPSCRTPIHCRIPARFAHQ
ncbi:putative E3 ubiquitin-protein ligase RF298 isoform X2 [Ricinus communis]|uniref:putative E3 ubiquitin-protein ligase RF298 isoform X2 n=1 Tax=Ricinus communis TaxID=3988 RepID=UPI00201A39FB|nr:putative E3 ubiquitin-protein ligase RF298 isoform X2 [Ricinus communis]